MSSKIRNAPVLRTLTKRHYAVAARAPASQEVDTQVLPNHTVISTVASPVKGLSEVAVAVRAGSRYESHDNQGVTHVLRAACGLTTAHMSQFGIARSLQKLGATLSATSDRETLVYTLRSTYDKLDESLHYFRAAILDPQFRPWELGDLVPQIKYELATTPKVATVLDLIHKAAFRKGLGNSVFVKEHKLKNIGTETIQHFVNSRFQSNKMAIVGMGVEPVTLSHLADKLNFSSGEGSPAEKSKYLGGEIRVEADIPIAYALIAGEGAGLRDKDVFAFAVLRNALGSGSSIKRGVGAGPITQALAKASQPAQAAAVNISHSDAGIFGVLVAGAPENMKEAVSSAAGALKAGISDADVARAKAQLKAQVLFNAETTENIMADLVNQCALLGGAKSASSLISEIDKVTTSDVKSALDKVNRSKKSMVALGNIDHVPYADEL